MSDPDRGQTAGRPPLPRDAFRSQRIGSVSGGSTDPKPVVVTPDYGDAVATETPAPPQPHAPMPKSKAPVRVSPDRNPFEAYGERSSSRPYALRLPDAIDLALRQIAAEQRTHPLRIIDRILYDHFKRIGRLPPAPGS